MAKKQRVDAETENRWNRTEIETMIESCLTQELGGMTPADMDHSIEIAGLLLSDRLNFDYALHYVTGLLDCNPVYGVEHYSRLERNFVRLGIKKK